MNTSTAAAPPVCACADVPLGPGETPPLGAHIVTPRDRYTHHGIYVGRGMVVQYTGLAHGLRSGPVEEVSLVQFTDGHPVCIRSAQAPCFDASEIVRRARSRLGEDRYRLLSNNCEHFCEWCLYAEHRSYQVDELFSRPWRALHLTRSAPSNGSAFTRLIQCIAGMNIAG